MSAFIALKYANYSTEVDIKKNERLNAIFNIIKNLNPDKDFVIDDLLSVPYKDFYELIGNAYRFGNYNQEKDLLKATLTFYKKAERSGYYVYDEYIHNSNTASGADAELGTKTAYAYARTWSEKRVRAHVG